MPYNQYISQEDCWSTVKTKSYDQNLFLWREFWDEEAYLKAHVSWSWLALDPA